MQQGNLVEESWNKKRIIIVIIMIAVLIGGSLVLKNLVLGKNSLTQKIESKSVVGVKGISTQEKPAIKIPLSIPNPVELKTDVQKKIEEIKKEASNLKVEDIASSSPQIQKLISDLNSLEQYPKNQVKGMCQKICDGL